MSSPRRRLIVSLAPEDYSALAELAKCHERDVTKEAMWLLRWAIFWVQGMGDSWDGLPVPKKVAEIRRLRNLCHRFLAEWETSQSAAIKAAGVNVEERHVHLSEEVGWRQLEIGGGGE